jgi:hypothetical protein
MYDETAYNTVSQTFPLLFVDYHKLARIIMENVLSYANELVEATSQHWPCPYVYYS